MFSNNKNLNRHIKKKPKTLYIKTETKTVSMEVKECGVVYAPYILPEYAPLIEPKIIKSMSELTDLYE